jgi:hypothetical protein
MTQDEAPAFLERLAALGEVFDAKFSEMKQQLYFEALKDLDLCDVVDGMNEALKTCKFMPRPAEIRELAVGSLEDQAGAAWAEWKELARRQGAYKQITAESVDGRSLVDVFGGWPQFCAADFSPEMWASKRKEFLQAYRRHARRRHEYPELCQLCGEFQHLAGALPLRDIPDERLLESSHE